MAGDAVVDVAAPADDFGAMDDREVVGRRNQRDKNFAKRFLDVEIALHRRNRDRPAEAGLLEWVGGENTGFLAIFGADVEPDRAGVPQIEQAAAEVRVQDQLIEARPRHGVLSHIGAGRGTRYAQAEQIEGHAIGVGDRRGARSRETGAPVARGRRRADDLPRCIPSDIDGVGETLLVERALQEGRITATEVCRDFPVEISPAQLKVAGKPADQAIEVGLRSRIGEHDIIAGSRKSEVRNPCREKRCSGLVGKQGIVGPERQSAALASEDHGIVGRLACQLGSLGIIIGAFGEKAHIVGNVEIEEEICRQPLEVAGDLTEREEAETVAAGDVDAAGRETGADVERHEVSVDVELGGIGIARRRAGDAGGSGR